MRSAAQVARRLRDEPVVRRQPLTHPATRRPARRRPVPAAARATSASPATARWRSSSRRTSGRAIHSSAQVDIRTRIVRPRMPIGGFCHRADVQLAGWAIRSTGRRDLLMARVSARAGARFSAAAAASRPPAAPARPATSAGRGLGSDRRPRPTPSASTRRSSCPRRWRRLPANGRCRDMTRAPDRRRGRRSPRAPGIRRNLRPRGADPLAELHDRLTRPPRIGADVDRADRRATAQHTPDVDVDRQHGLLETRSSEPRRRRTRRHPAARSGPPATPESATIGAEPVPVCARRG